MNPRITDYGAFMYCEECANIALEHEWDDDLGMCAACASVGTEGEGEEDD